MEAAAVRQMGAHNAAMLAMASAVAALPARLTQPIYILVDGAILPEVNEERAHAVQFIHAQYLCYEDC